jgi:hypothetical protein
MPRYELPPDLSPEEERAVIAALEEALGGRREARSPWAVQGRVEALRLGSLQARRDVPDAWRLRGSAPFARRGTAPHVGRGDAR